jgi:hypothetical protein
MYTMMLQSGQSYRSNLQYALDMRGYVWQKDYNVTINK